MKRITGKHGLIRLKTFMMLLFMAVVIPGLSIQAKAAGAPSCEKKQIRYFMLAPSTDGKTYTVVSDGYKRTSKQVDMYEYNGIAIKNLSKSARITNIKSSNKNFKVSYQPEAYEKGLVVFFAQQGGTVKFGKSKITFTVTQGGESYKLSCNYIMKKTPSPLKSIKIDGKEYKSELAGKDRITIKTGKSSVNVSFKASSKIKGLEITYYDKEGTEHTLQNNSQISIPKRGVELGIKYRYKESTGFYKKYKKKYGYQCFENRSIMLKR